MQAQIAEATRLPPQLVRPRPNTHNLLTQDDDTTVDSFIDIFESQLTMAEVPEDKWKPILVEQLNSECRFMLTKVIADPESTYDDECN